jgi:hypothetical protein
LVVGLGAPKHLHKHGRRTRHCGAFTFFRGRLALSELGKKVQVEIEIKAFCVWRVTMNTVFEAEV